MRRYALFIWFVTQEMGWMAADSAAEMRFDWSDVPVAAASPAIEVVQDGAEDGAAAVRITGTPGEETTHRLLQLDDPEVEGEIYAFEGRIRYEGVEGRGYLESWNEFPDGHRYFSRTFAPEGATAAIEGASDWRTFSVPFNRSGTAMTPRRLEFQLVLPGAGTVWLGPVVLKEISRSGAGPPPYAFVWAPWAVTAIAVVVLGTIVLLVVVLRKT